MGQVETRTIWGWWKLGFRFAWHVGSLEAAAFCEALRMWRLEIRNRAIARWRLAQLQDEENEPAYVREYGRRLRQHLTEKMEG